MQQTKMRRKKSFLFAMNSKLPFASPGLRCSVWTVKKINRLRNQSTHSWKSIYLATATARWSNYLLSLCAFFFLFRCLLRRVLVSPTLLKLSAALHNNGFVIFFLLFPLKNRGDRFISMPFDECRPDRLLFFYFCERAIFNVLEKKKMKWWGNPTTERIDEMILIICDFSCLLDPPISNLFLHASLFPQRRLGKRNYKPLFHN